METIKLNLIPGTISPVVHVSQYDVGRVFRCLLFEGSSEYVLSNETITIYVRKPDGKLVTAEVTVTSGAKYVDISTTQQMDAVAGKNICELKISKGAAVIGTINFYMEVERDPTDGAIASESEIHDLQAQVDADVQEYLSHYASEAIGFDPTGTDLESTNVEDAIKEVNQKVNDIPDPTADNVEFDNDGTDLASTNVEDVIKEVNTKVNNLPSPMVYKGTVGDSGTVEWANLPAPSSSGQSKNVGFTYKVITDHNTAPICEAGDVIVSDGTEWTVVPSGDEPSGTVTNVATGAGLTGGPITSTGTIKANLRSETPLTRDSVAATEEADRVFAVVPDKSGKLAVVVPAGADIDDAHTSDRKTWSSEKISEELDKKADTDGEYAELKAGNLVPTTYEEDEVPYLFRTSGGSIDIGEQEEDMLVGGTVAFNQLINANTEAWTTYSHGTQNFIYPLNFRLNHKYLVRCEFRLSDNTDRFTFVSVGFWNSAMNKYKRKDITSNVSSTNKAEVILSYSASDLPDGTTESDFVNFVYQEITSLQTSPIDYRHFNVIDLTQMFGSTIADYIYSLEQGTAGAGVAWFRSLFPKDYYAYNAGELMSVKASKHIMTGFNAWDEEWEVGGISDTTGQNTPSSSNIRSKNYIQVESSTTYYFVTANKVMYLREYDANKNYLGQIQVTSNGAKITSANTKYLRFVMGSAYGTTYNHDVCINLHWDGERDGEYEPYVKYEYPLDSNLELRGIPKLDANNKLYYDGDTYESDGTVTRKYGVVDLSSLTWTWQTSNDRWITSGLASTIKKYEDAYTKIPAISSKYTAIVYDASLPANTIAYYGTNGNVFVNNGSTTETPTGYLIYELATPTTEEAEPFTNPQKVNDFGTEEYEDNRTVPIPVGHYTKYPPNLRAKLEMAPDSPSGDGDYIVRQSNGENSYVLLTKELPTPPSSNGTYVLKCTKSGSSVTYSWVAET